MDSLDKVLKDLVKLYEDGSITLGDLDCLVGRLINQELPPEDVDLARVWEEGKRR